MSSETSLTGQHASLRRLHPTANILLLCLTALWCAYWFLKALGYWEDDAYIHLEFARSLSAGRGFSFNGLVVGGDTAPLWVILLAAVHLVVPDWLAAGKLLALLGAIAGFTGIYAFARFIARELLGTDRAQAFAAAIVLLSAVNPYTCYWIFSGMESFAAAGVACWITLIAMRERPTAASFLAGCALAGTAPLLRPEMLLLTLLLATAFLRQGRQLGAGLRTRPLILAVSVVLLTGPVAGWSLYSYHAFGHILPTTYAAKRAIPGESVWFRLLKLYAFGLPFLLAAPAALRGRLGPLRRLPRAASIFLLWTALTFVFYAANHTYVQSRYVLMTAPGLITVLLAVMLTSPLRSGRMIYAFALGWSVVLSLIVVRPFLRNKQINCRATAQMASFIRDRVPSGAPIAAYSIGEIAFLSEHALVDTGGITRPAALAYLNAGSDIQMTRWAKTEGALYQIAGAKPPETGAQQVYSVAVPFIGWTLHLSDYQSTDTMCLWKLSPNVSPIAANSMPSHP